MKAYRSRIKIIILVGVILIVFIVGATFFTYSKLNIVEKF